MTGTIPEMHIQVHLTISAMITKLTKFSAGNFLHMFSPNFSLSLSLAGLLLIDEVFLFGVLLV